MQYSTNFNMNKPELAEQYRLSHWNENTDIIDNAMQAIRSGTDDVMKATLLNFCYPIGSIYWSGVATNPHDLFGGTWEQIKDKFIWAKGDNDTLDATGGSKTVTLTVEQMPVHTHTMENAGSHSHTTNTLTNNSGTAITTTANQSANPTFSGSASHSHNVIHSTMTGQNLVYTYNGVGNNVKGVRFNAGSTSVTNDTGTIITDSKTVTISGTTSGNHNHNFEHKHGTDSQGSHSHTINATGGLNGTTQAHNNMPPYIVKYCWQRTA